MWGGSAGRDSPHDTRPAPDRPEPLSDPMDATPTQTEPCRTCPRAKFALAVAVVALALSVYGALLSEVNLAGSRLNEARGAAGAEFTRTSDTMRAAVAVV